MKSVFLIVLFANIAFSSSLFAKKLLMIVVEKEQCAWCTKMEKEILSDTKVLAKLNERYYVVKIKIESGNLPSFVHVKYFPTTFVYSPDGTELIDSLIGYRTKEKFLKFFDTDYEMDDSIL